MKKPPEILVQHILECIERIEINIEDLSENEFHENVTIQDALVRRLEIIGEASRNLPSEFKQAHPQIPWLDIADMRNRLIHEYFNVDLDLVWDIVTLEIPTLKKQLEKILL
ncbi:MAG: HepT-like ribonuclease domain-containing protein [Candidatus Levyibacteriota bacterium]